MLEAGLAAYRITRFIVADTIFDRPRERVQNWLLENDHPKLNEGLACGYCVSVWVALALTIRHRSLTRLMAVSGLAAAVWSLDRLAAASEA
jgi:hypothetical protein